MIYKNIEVHNAAAVEQKSGYPGMFLPRYPKSVRHKMCDRGKFVSAWSSGVELRFVTPARIFQATVSAYDVDGAAHVYKGDVLVGNYDLPRGRMITIHQEVLPMFDLVKDSMFKNTHFSNDVWRIEFDSYAGVFHVLETFGAPVRPPKPSEKPKLRWLAYGSSITNTCNTGYVYFAAKQLGADMMNKGMSGACMCEKEAADYLAAGCGKWDFATLELGVNMRGNFDKEEFEKRARYLIKRITAKNPGKPVFVITIFPNHATYFKKDDWCSDTEKAFNRILRTIVTRSKNKNLILIEGSKVLDTTGCLSEDLIHPSFFGHARMGNNLACILKASGRI